MKERGQKIKIVKRKCYSTPESNCSKYLRKDKHAEEEKQTKFLGNLTLKLIEELNKCKLPSNKQVLQRFFGLQNSNPSNLAKKDKYSRKVID